MWLENFNLRGGASSAGHGVLSGTPAQAGDTADPS
jgi:hypothetical protein